MIKKATQVRNQLVDIMRGFAGKESFITIPKVFIDFCDGDLVIAAFFSQALFWTGVTDDPDGWIVKSYEDWCDDVRLSRSQVERATKALKQIGLETKKARSRFHKFAPVIHYRFNQDVLNAKAEAFFSDGFAEKPQMRGNRKSNLPLSSKSEVLDLSKSLYTETIEESIEEKKENTSDAPASERASDSQQNAPSPDTQKPAREGNVSPSRDTAPSNKKTAKAKDKPQTATTPSIPPVAPAPLSPAPVEADSAAASVPTAEVKAVGAKKARKPNRMAVIIDAAWRKGVSGYLLPQLMGKADKPDRKPYNLDTPCHEAEVWAFCNWWRSNHPAHIQVPTKASSVHDAMIEFRGSKDYERRVSDAEYDVNKMYPREDAPPLETPAPARPASAEQLADVKDALTRLIDSFRQENVS